MGSLVRDERSTKRAGGHVKLSPKAYYALTILTALNAINLWHRYLIVSVIPCP